MVEGSGREKAGEKPESGYEVRGGSGGDPAEMRCSDCLQGAPSLDQWASPVCEFWHCLLLFFALELPPSVGSLGLGVKVSLHFHFLFSQS